MPIKIPDTLPAKRILEKENIFVMSENKAVKQDIRPIKILILNLMPTKTETETQLLRLLSNTPLQVDIELMQMATHTSKNTSKEYLLKYYCTFDEIKNKKFDGMIITGAPVEQLEFEEVDYYKELCEILEWSKTNVYSTFHICWGAQVGLYYHYGIKKYPLSEKMFGVFRHKITKKNHNLTRGFNEEFWAPHSRHTGIKKEDVKNCKNLDILAYSEMAGIYLISSKDGRQIFVTGHSEYDSDTLAKEYFRDVEKGLDIKMPYNYFTNDDPKSKPIAKWRAHANLLFSNWLNYFVYQGVPYNFINK